MNATSSYDMSQTIRIAPPHSLLFISGPEDDQPIDFSFMKTIRWNSTCVAVSCLPFIDGETEVTLGAAKEVDPGWAPAFDDIVIAQGSIVVSTSERTTLLEVPITGDQTRVKVWINEDEEPDRVIVGIG
ncbi:MAG: hypothetical protein KF835_03430 [Xanthobacteraceae bacterium]|nr:hypothetical protein [Xanthobacteraceae bacterium]